MLIRGPLSFTNWQDTRNRNAAVHRDKADHLTAHELSQQAMEYATQAFRHSREATPEIRKR